LEVLAAAEDVALTDWVIEHAGKPVGSVKKAFARAAIRAGFKEQVGETEDGQPIWKATVSPHTLRHTAATWMIQDGVETREVARYLGDTEKMVERVYGHHAPDYLKRAAAALRRK
jgi:integrase